MFFVAVFFSSEDTIRCENLNYAFAPNIFMIRDYGRAGVVFFLPAYPSPLVVGVDLNFVAVDNIHSVVHIKPKFCL